MGPLSNCLSNYPPQAEQPRKKELSAAIRLNNMLNNMLTNATKQATRQVATLAVSTFILSVTAAAIGDLSALGQALGQASGQASTQSAPAAQTSYPLLATGSTGESVSELQAILKLLGFYQGAVDGSYSQPTLEAVAQFQSAAGISADGITGPSTWQKLLPAPSDVTNIAEAPRAPEPVASAATSNSVATGGTAPLGPPILRAEAAGPAVSQLQRELQELGYYNGPIDGGFGAQTQASVEKFQSDQQLFVDGVVGPSTWDALSQALDQ
jgi:N-acetylmuramoyl-L-alanine amidase